MTNAQDREWVKRAVIGCVGSGTTIVPVITLETQAKHWGIVKGITDENEIKEIVVDVMEHLGLTNVIG